MSASSETLSCPKCRQPLTDSVQVNGEPIVCKKCGAKVQVPPKGPTTDLLGWLEDLLVKMIRGIFQFILVHLPREFYRAIVQWFPTLMKLIRIICLLIVWLVSAFSPLATVALRKYGTDWIDRSSVLNSSWYLTHPAVWDAVCYVYSVLALIGSVWGVLYIKRRRKLARLAQQSR